MIYFIIRRLILTVFLLLLVSMITFAIFFLVPRLAGQTSYSSPRSTWAATRSRRRSRRSRPSSA